MGNCCTRNTAMCCRCRGPRAPVRIPSSSLTTHPCRLRVSLVGQSSCRSLGGVFCGQLWRKRAAAAVSRSREAFPTEAGARIVKRCALRRVARSAVTLTDEHAGVHYTTETRARV